MAVLPIVLYPDTRLREQARPVTAVDERLRRLVKDMAETMYEASGVGLAATQVGVMQRLALIDCDPRGEQSQLIVLINPEILTRSGDSYEEEGSLSVPGYNANVHRATNVRARWQDLDGQSHEVEADGLFAIALQHEIDHLDGKLFIDYLSPLKREMFKKKYRKMQQAAQEARETA